MTRRLVLAAALALVLVPQTFAAGTWHKSMTAAQKAAKEKNQFILVDMFAEWCGWCHRFEREVFPAEAFQNATKDIVLLRLDTEDGADGTKYARQFGVTSLPTFVLLTSDLTLAGQIKGYAPAQQFVNLLNETRRKYDAFQRAAKNEPSMAKDYPARLDLAKEYFTRNQYDKAEPRLKKLIAEKGVPAAIRDEAYFQLAVTYVMQNKLDDALKTVNQLTALSKLGDFVERSKVLAGQIYLQQGNLLSAANEFRNFKKNHPNSPLIPNVNAWLPDIERRLAGK